MHGTEVEAGVIGVVRGVEGEARVVVAACGTGEVVRATERVGGPLEGAVRPSASAMWVVRSPRGMV
jgi:hypothetical protein